jgi:uncharacterized membrane protein
MMMALAVRYLVVLLVLAAGDALWLSWFAPAMVRPMAGSIMLDHVRWSGVAAFYLFYAGGVLLFPLGLARDGMSAFVYGALFGFLAYMTYDTTNYTTLKAWTLPVAVMDVGWGAFLTALASLAGFWLARRF